jgi:hypothetical protein
MRAFAIIVNFIALGILGFIFYEEQAWEYSDSCLVGALCLVYIGINIVALKWGSSSGGWLWLYLKRKRLEEKKKIETLEKQVNE